MDYIEKLDLQTKEVKEVETLEKHSIINNDPFSVDDYIGHTREFLAVEGEYDDGFNQLNETNSLGISCEVHADPALLLNAIDYRKMYKSINW